MIDRMRSVGLKRPPDLREAELRDLERLHDAVPFDVQNVTDYLAGLGKTRRADVHFRDLPSIVPPFPAVFAETRLPAVPGWEAWFGNPLAAAIRGWGTLVLTNELLDPDEDEATRQASANAWAESILRRGDETARLTSDVRWAMTTYAFFDQNDGGVTGPHLTGTVFLGANGEGAATNARDGLAAIGYGYGSLDGDIVGYYLRQLNMPVVFAFSLLHCRNVALVENAGRFGSRQERRAAERKGTPPPEKYYTLEIGAMSRTLATEGGIATNGLKRALHICRGHFAHYSDERPLFGKYAGQFWIPAHVRGSAESGAVVKDYAVRAPDEAAA